MRKPHAGLCALAALLVLPCRGLAQQPDLLPHDGKLRVPGGMVAYRVTGTGGGIPLLVIHGGPGGFSCRLRGLDLLGADRPVVYYDQLGCGRSDAPADTSLWTLAHFVAEVDAVRDALGLREVVLLGHSWGGSVATEYVLTHPRSGVRALVLVGPLLSTARTLADGKMLVAQLPASARQAIATADSTGNYDTPEFLAANDSFNARFVRRNQATSYPQCAGLQMNHEIYRYMWGPSEFRSTGTLRSFDRTNRLGELALPVLLLGGEFDEARPETLRHFQRLIPASEVVTIPGAAHMVMIDAPLATTKAIHNFLARRLRGH